MVRSSCTCFIIPEKHVWLCVFNIQFAILLLESVVDLVFGTCYRSSCDEMFDFRKMCVDIYSHKVKSPVFSLECVADMIFSFRSTFQE